MLGIPDQLIAFCALIMLIGVAGITVAGGLWILTKLTSDYRR
jgi:heme/copper-type cytochrome/quinol oxidase subunit 4